MSRLAARLDRATRAALEHRHPLDQLKRLHARTAGAMREAEVAIAAVDRADLEALGRATEADWPALAAYSAEWIALDMPDAPRASTAWAAVHLPSPTPDAIAEARRALDLPEPAGVTERAMWHVLRMWARYVLTSAE